MHWAGRTDLPEVMALLDARRRWLHERGSDQWSPDRAFATRMANAVDRRETVLFRDDGVSIATVTVTPEGDPDFWTPDELKESALYLGKMASAVFRSGEGLGSLMLSWVQDWAARSGFESLRWDVWRTNGELQDYYRSIGGRYVRTVHADHRWSGALFQIPARRISHLTDCVVEVLAEAPVPKVERLTTREGIMKIRFLGKESEYRDSPTLYATERCTYLVQGWKVTDPEILTKLDVPESETVVEVYARLMSHLTKDGLSGVVTSWTPPIVHIKENGNLIIQGKRVADPEALAELKIPDHEDVVEVDKAAIEALLGEE
ncbi:MAG: GNAT family N-acetyltransferase [Gammaproteobacteria bacterium]